MASARVAMFATLPEREPLLATAVRSLEGQVDSFRVYLNGHSAVPKFLRRGNVEVVQSSENQGVVAKFHWSMVARDEYQFFCDDDIIYPNDYADRMLSTLSTHGGRCVVGVHGVTLREPMRSYFADRSVFHFEHGCPTDTPVHLVGTGCMLMRGDLVRIAPDDFIHKNMGDVSFGLVCQKQRIPVVCVKRENGWLRGQYVSGFSVYNTYKNNDATRTEAVRSVWPWRTHLATGAGIE